MCRYASSTPSRRQSKLRKNKGNLFLKPWEKRKFLQGALLQPQSQEENLWLKRSLRSSSFSCPQVKLPRSPRRFDARPARHQHPRLYQRVQREDRRPGGADHSRCHHHLSGSVVYLYPEDAARARAHQKGVQDRKRQRSPQPRQSRQAHQAAGRRDRQAEKMPDLNTVSLESAMSMVKGTARSMGITVEE